jgi:hypothetical protein
MRDMEATPQRDFGNQIPKNPRPTEGEYENEERKKPTARLVRLLEVSTYHRDPLPLGGPLWFSDATVQCRHPCAGSPSPKCKVVPRKKSCQLVVVYDPFAAMRQRRRE